MAAAPRSSVIRHLEPVMGTVVTIDVYPAAPGQAASASAGELLRRRVDRAVAVLHRADEVFSTWDAASPVSRLRRGEITAAQAPAEVAEVLRDCAAVREMSAGWFDPWAMPGGVDPTGYVKGWAARRALAALAGPGIRGAMVNAAGDIASLGGPAPGERFRIGITDPWQPKRLTCVIELGSAGAVATSGGYERGGHLIDPRTGRPAARAASASVTGPDLGVADALATALAVAGEPGLELAGAAGGYEALLALPDGSWRWTERFPFAAGHAPSPGAPAARRAG